MSFNKKVGVIGSSSVEQEDKTKIKMTVVKIDDFMGYINF